MLRERMFRVRLQAALRLLTSVFGVALEAVGAALLVGLARHRARLRLGLFLGLGGLAALVWGGHVGLVWGVVVGKAGGLLDRVDKGRKMEGEVGDERAMVGRAMDGGDACWWDERTVLYCRIIRFLHPIISIHNSNHPRINRRTYLSGSKSQL